MEKLQKFGVIGEMTFFLRDKDGNSKEIWNENFLGKILRKAGLEARIQFLTGQFKEGMVTRNLITNAGFAEIANLLGNVSAPVAFTFLAVGTGTTPADPADTDLEAEIVDSGLERAGATVSRVTTTETNDTLQLTNTWIVSGSKAVTECGAFNDDTAGIMLGHQVFSAINVESGDSLQIIYKFQVSA